MIADLEKIASGWLREQTELRVVGKPPSDTETPWVQVVQLDATDEANSRAEHLISYLMQFDVYSGRGGGQPEANTLGRRVRAALHELPGVRDGAVVTATRVVGDARIPDPTFTPARERRVLSATIWAHQA